MRSDKTTLRAPGYEDANQRAENNQDDKKGGTRPDIRHTNPYNPDKIVGHVPVQEVVIPPNPAPQFSTSELEALADLILNPSATTASDINPDAGRILNTSCDTGRQTLAGVASFHNGIREREKQIETIAEKWLNSEPIPPSDVQEQLFTSNHTLYCSSLPAIIAAADHEGDRIHLEEVLRQMKAATNWTMLSSAIDSFINHAYQPPTFLKVNVLWQQAKKEGQNSTDIALSESNDRIFQAFRNLLPPSITVKNGRYSTNSSNSELRCELEVKGQTFVLEFNAYYQTIVDIAFPHNTENTPVLRKFAGRKLNEKTIKSLETTLFKIAENPDGYISKEPPAPETFALHQTIQKIHKAFQTAYNATKANPDAWLSIESIIDQGKVIVTARVGNVSETFEVFGSTRKRFFRTIQDLRIHSSNDAIAGQAFNTTTLQKILNTLRKDRESFIPPEPKVSFAQRIKSSFKNLWGRVAPVAESVSPLVARAQTWLGEKWNTLTSWLSVDAQPTNRAETKSDDTSIQIRIPPQKASFFEGKWIRKTAWAGLLLSTMSSGDYITKNTQRFHAPETTLFTDASLPITTNAPSSSSSPLPLPSSSPLPSPLPSPSSSLERPSSTMETPVPAKAELTITLDGSHGNVTFVQALYSYLHSSAYRSANPGYTPHRGDAWRMMSAMTKTSGQYESFHRLYHNVHRGDRFSFRTVGNNIELTSWRHRDGHEHLQSTVSLSATR